MEFDTVLQLLTGQFQKHKIPNALIGGFALHAAGYWRTTEDVDFLISQKDAPKVKNIMASLGFELLHESTDVLNFGGRLKQLGRVDFLLAHRKYATKMLERAQEKSILENRIPIKIITAEDTIGLKVQSSSNDPSRYYQDMADIEAVLRLNKNKLDLKLIREYFELFDRGQELEAILKRYAD